jgi:hypothetical protein
MQLTSDNRIHRPELYASPAKHQSRLLAQHRAEPRLPRCISPMNGQTTFFAEQVQETAKSHRALYRIQ